MTTKIPKALTIAGSDSGGGAGIQADLKTFTALGVYGLSVLTALTAQNTLGVQGVHEVPTDFIALQLDSVLGDIGTDAAKTGMLSSTPIIRTVSEKIRQYCIKKLVVDPVMVAKSGDPLLKEEAQGTLIRELLPLALVVTPNLPEAGVLAGMRVKTLNEMEEAVRRIGALGPRYVLVKGGHLTGPAVDLLWDGKVLERFEAERIQTPHTHGTGCTYSAAIAAYLARGLAVSQAVRRAKAYLTAALREALAIGRGIGSLKHHITVGAAP